MRSSDNLRTHADTDCCKGLVDSGRLKSILVNAQQINVSAPIIR